MKAITFLFALLLSVLTPFAFAQTSGAIPPPGHQMLASPEAFADGHLAALDKQVKLTADQKPKARAVFMSEAKELFALFGDQSISQDQKAARIQKIHIATRDQIWNLLTHEQRKAMTEGPAPPRPVA
jgi:hypothetical protein